MISGLPMTEIVTLAAMLAASGLLIGFLAGLLGVGGGGIAMPVLYELFRILEVSDGIRMQVCAATSLAIMIPTSIRSARSHWQQGSVDFLVIRRLGPWVVMGAALGVLIASNAPSGFLKSVFAASMLFLAWRILSGSGNANAIEARKLPGQPWNGLTGAGVGMLSALIGIGGGVYITSFMKFFGWPIHKSVGTASAFGPLIAIPAMIGYIVAGWNVPVGVPLSLGFVSAAGAIAVAPMSVLAAPLGVKFAHKLSHRTLEYLFAGFLLTVAARFAASLLLHV
jgi:uncharacterized membrane protein YfcA